jgi:hypothetical protein
MKSGYLSCLLVAITAWGLHPSLVGGEDCPWMTEGSAVKLLGGEVTATADAADDKRGSCTFSRQDSKMSRRLEILVGPEESGACPAGSEGLRGIGNEALFCRVKQSATESVAKVSSRVRGTFLTVTLTSSGPRSARSAGEAEQEIARQAAEMVAGNLF